MPRKRCRLAGNRISLRIRGQRSILASSEPLLITTRRQ